MAENSKNIWDAGVELYSRINTLLEHIENIENHLIIGANLVPALIKVYFGINIALSLYRR